MNTLSMSTTVSILCRLSMLIVLIGMFASCAPDDINASGGGSGVALQPVSVYMLLSTTAVPSPPGTVDIIAGAFDGFGTGVPGVIVTFSSTDPTAGTFTPVAATTDANGMVTAQFTAADVNILIDITATVVAGSTVLTDTWPLTIGTAPLAPAGVTATASATAGQIDLSWTASTEASTYTIYWGTASGVLTNPITGLTGTTYTHTGRTAGTTYYYAMTSVNPLGESAMSPETSAVAP